MKISAITSVNFGRRLKADEETGYTETLKQAKEACGNKGKSVLIVPSSSLPQSKELNTGVGNLASKDGLEFFDFAKKYWGRNGVQILPIGQYHSHRGEYPIYSGTSMDLGNHVIDIRGDCRHCQSQLLCNIGPLDGTAIINCFEDGRSAGCY